MEGKKCIVVGATAASGVPLLVQCLKLIRADARFSSTLILSQHCERTMEVEWSGGVADLEELADEVFAPDDIAAGPASGTWPAAGMLVVPCSMKTVAGIHSGYSDNLLLRAADVTLKEQRPLVLCVRESPLSAIHLRNLYDLSLIPGVHIIPPMLSFYQSPESIEDMVYHVAARLVEPFGVEAREFRRWNTN